MGRGFLEGQGHSVICAGVGGSSKDGCEDALSPGPCAQQALDSMLSQPRVRFFVLFLKILYLFLERGREGEREGEKQQCVVASRAPPTGSLAHNPDKCPDCELNRQPFGLQASTQSTEPHQAGSRVSFYTSGGRSAEPSRSPGTWARRDHGHGESEVSSTHGGSEPVNQEVAPVHGQAKGRQGALGSLDVHLPREPPTPLNPHVP